MTRMLSDGTVFGCWISWECGACGEQGGFQADSDDHEVWVSIDHYCEVDNDV